MGSSALMYTKIAYLILVATKINFIVRLTTINLINLQLIKIANYLLTNLNGALR